MATTPRGKTGCGPGCEREARSGGHILILLCEDVTHSGVSTCTICTDCNSSCPSVCQSHAAVGECEIKYFI